MAQYIKEGVVFSTHELRALFPNVSIPEGGGMEDYGFSLWTAPPPNPMSPQKLRTRLKESATDLRWILETGGVTLPNGMRLGTDRDDQNSIANAVSLMSLVGSTEVDFKAVSGWVSLTLPELQQIAAAVGAHKQACFTAERAHHEAIDALADADLAGYNIEAGWPGTTVL